MSGSDEVSGRGVNYARGQRRRFGRAQANAARLAAEALRIAQAAAAAADALQGPRPDGALPAARRGDAGPRLFEPKRRGSDGGRSSPKDLPSLPAAVAASRGQTTASGGHADRARPVGQHRPLLSEPASAQTQHAIGSGPAALAVQTPFVSVIQGARGTLIGCVGGLSTGQLTMALAALEFAGPSFLPDARRLDIKRGCSSGCGNVAGLDSTMAGAVSILQGGGSVAQAARFLLEGLSSHACDGACRRAPRLSSVLVDSPSERPVRLPPHHSRPRKQDALRSPSPGRRLPPPSKRQRGNPRAPIAVPDGAADGHTNAGTHKTDGGSGELPWLFPRNAERRVELSRGDSQSIRARGAFTQRIGDGVFFWFLSRSVTARSRGGFRVLWSMTADAFVGAAAGTSWGVRLGGKAIKDGMILSGGLSVMPVRTGRVWWGVVVRDLDKLLPLLVKYMRGEIDSLTVPASSEGAVIVIDTSGVGKGDGGWNDRVLNGLFKVLARTVVQTYSINANELGHTQNNLRTMLPMRVVAPRRSFADETADNLLAYVAALVGAPDDAARGALLDADSSDWRKAPTPPIFATSCDTFSWPTTPRMPNSTKNSKPKRL